MYSYITSAGKMVMKAKGFSLNTGLASHLKFSEYVALLFARCADLEDFYQNIPDQAVKEKAQKLAAKLHQASQQRCSTHGTAAEKGQPTQDVLPGARGGAVLVVPAPKFIRTLHPVPSVRTDNTTVKVARVYFTKRRIAPEVPQMFNLPLIGISSLPFGYDTETAANESMHIDEPEILFSNAPDGGMPRLLFEPAEESGDRIAYLLQRDLDRNAINDEPLDELIRLMQMEVAE